MAEATTTVAVRLVVIDPPFEESHGVLFGPQRGKVVEEFATACTTAFFDMSFDVVGPPGDYDFRGPFVHGKRGDRFLYLSWGLPDAGAPFVMFARAKLNLVDAPPDLIAEAIERSAPLRCDLAATNQRGEPASGTIRSPDVSWSIDS